MFSEGKGEAQSKSLILSHYCMLLFYPIFALRGQRQLIFGARNATWVWKLSGQCRVHSKLVILLTRTQHHLHLTCTLHLWICTSQLFLSERKKCRKYDKNYSCALMICINLAIFKKRNYLASYGYLHKTTILPAIFPPFTWQDININIGSTFWISKNVKSTDARGFTEKTKTSHYFF